MLTLAVRQKPSVGPLLDVRTGVGLRRGGLPEPDEGVGEGTADHHEDTEPPEGRLHVGVVHDGDERLHDGLGIGADMVRHWRRDVDLYGADPTDEKAEQAGDNEQ